MLNSALKASFSQVGFKGGADGSSAYNNRVTLTKGICVVNGILYFKMSNANEHVLSNMETSVMTTGVKLPEPTTESDKITEVKSLVDKGATESL